MKFIIDNNIPYITGAFEAFCDVGYFPAKEIVPSVVADADALIIRTRTYCNAALLAGSKVKLIATATIGFDHIDLDYCAKHGIKVVNCAGCNAAAVGQWVFAALMELKADGVLGIIGVGNVGKEVARIAVSKGMSILKCDPPRAEKEGSADFVELTELLFKSDIVTVHVPLNKVTHNICNDHFFNCFQGTTFINTSRGEVVDENALMRAIESGNVKNCALDVWQNEPNINRDLVRLSNIATPHIAGYSMRGKANATRMVVQEVANFFNLNNLKSWQPNIEASIENPADYDILSDDKSLRSEFDFEKLRTNYKYR